jgi:hypothetical protein
LSSSGPSGNERQYLKKTYKLQRDIILVEALPFEPPFADEAYNREHYGSKQEILMTIPAGTEVVVLRVIKRHLPPGVCFSYVCKVKNNNKKFDLGFNMRDVIGLPECVSVDDRKWERIGETPYYNYKFKN